MGIRDAFEAVEPVVTGVATLAAAQGARLRHLEALVTPAREALPTFTNTRT